MKIILKIQLIIVVIVLLLNMNGYMTYGYGLGDIYCIGVFITLLHFTSTNKKGFDHGYPHFYIINI